MAAARRSPSVCARLGVQGVVLEATGGLERPVLAALTAAELPGSIVNPARVRAFAEGTGQLAKTDRIDAKVLASYGAYMQPVATALPSSARAKLKELLGYRAQIGEEITARCAQFKLYESDSLRARAQAALDALRRERLELEREIESICSVAMRNSPSRFKILTSAPSVGIDRGSDPGGRAAGAGHHGPAPHRRARRPGAVSMRQRRAARLPRHPRRALGCAQSPLQRRPRGHPAQSRSSRRSTSACAPDGKPGKVALVAAMHKLLTILNAMLRSGRTWQPSMAQQQQQTKRLVRETCEPLQAS